MTAETKPFNPIRFFLVWTVVLLVVSEVSALLQLPIARALPGPLGSQLRILAYVPFTLAVAAAEWWLLRPHLRFSLRSWLIVTGVVKVVLQFLAGTFLVQFAHGDYGPRSHAVIAWELISVGIAASAQAWVLNEATPGWIAWIAACVIGALAARYLGLLAFDGRPTLLSTPLLLLVRTMALGLAAISMIGEPRTGDAAAPVS